MSISGINQSNITFLNALSVTTTKSNTAAKDVAPAYYSDYKNFTASTSNSPPMSEDKFKEAIIAQAKKMPHPGKLAANPQVA